MSSQFSLRLRCTATFAVVSMHGCSERYPIAPTLCDDWCNIENPHGCFFVFSPFQPHDQQTPADCVSNCEINPGVTGSQCAPRFATYIECVKRVVASNDCPNIGASNCDSEWYQIGDCEACIGRDCTICKDYCSLPANNCGIAGLGCVASCAQQMPEDPRCIPAFQTYIDCHKRNNINYCGGVPYDPTGDAGVPVDACAIESNQLNQCRTCYDYHNESYCTK